MRKGFESLIQLGPRELLFSTTENCTIEDGGILLRTSPDFLTRFGATASVPAFVCAALALEKAQGSLTDQLGSLEVDFAQNLMQGDTLVVAGSSKEKGQGTAVGKIGNDAAIGVEAYCEPESEGSTALQEIAELAIMLQADGFSCEEDHLLYTRPAEDLAGVFFQILTVANMAGAAKMMDQHPGTNWITARILLNMYEKLQTQAQIACRIESVRTPKDSAADVSIQILANQTELGSADFSYGRLPE